MISTVSGAEWLSLLLWWLLLLGGSMVIRLGARRYRRQVRPDPPNEYMRRFSEHVRAYLPVIRQVSSGVLLAPLVGFVLSTAVYRDGAEDIVYWTLVTPALVWTVLYLVMVATFFTARRWARHDLLKEPERH